LDQTGQLPVTSYRGFNNIFVLYHYDSNTIKVEPLRTKEGGELHDAFKKVHNFYKKQGLMINLHIMDNEAPKLLKKYINKEVGEYQLVPSHTHTNAMQQKEQYALSKINSLWD